MYGVVLAAGRGTRMRPLTDRRPKPLLPVGDRSLLERVFDTAIDVVDEFVVVTGYRGDAIREAIGESYRDRPVSYVEQAAAKGTAHAVAQAEPVVDDDFLVLNGDVVVDASLPRALADAEGTAVAATEVPDPRAYGVLSTADDGSLAGIVEKPADPPTNFANVGCYAFGPEVFEYIDRTPESERSEYEITTTIELLLDDGHQIDVARYDGTWLDVGRPWELLEANELALAEYDDDPELAGTVEDEVHLHGPVVVEEGARVRSGAYVEGPALIREGADVGPNAYVRGATVIGPDAHVGHAVEVKNSVLMADASVGHLSYVGDSVLGRAVNFGAGTNVANLRHDGENVRLGVKGDRVDTGRRKLGVIVGDGAKTGINTSLNAGVKLGADEATGPGEALTRDRLSE
ncbi:bifunctional sugar-1-phosphate nucleotidylyltransferase/acetyltransferase [Halorubrum sp. GN11GM_10-3_MGM]|uniref:bifunctional sugar-1-phosphate nucleotidylyltransferase/acetyltransferase n=1 Tax=Halorubrum sp. GN11GM_10-3_MGM TaxID=2518111 RepID=UPI0010F7C446|nr:bifunctional sugar-1-phosphate nucleotidylyltransferase/acetyltransferase [Halorubrum sp. GN11GM_10-3_MGM]TKX71848.1 glucose-1-phosphate thymidylyltransferase [Halorubrum sp. GN11GM_10-3_MGM]